MTMHLFGAVLTAKGTAANNRGEVEGTASTLQKIIRNGEIYSTVSAEAIRYALREGWQEDSSLTVNRKVLSHRGVELQDREFKGWKDNIDDDILGFMHARKETVSRRGVLEVTRAISTTPWNGELSHNFASPGANPIGNKDPIPYAVEEHHTRYQYGLAMTPDAIEKDKGVRVEKTLLGIQNLRRVAGNHARFLFDFSPEVIVLRWTLDPAPRMLLCFDEDERGAISLSRLIGRTKGEVPDIAASELTIGCALANVEGLGELRAAGAKVCDGVKEAVSVIIARVRQHFNATAKGGAKGR